MSQRIEKPWGYEEILYAEGDRRVKLLHLNPGQRTSLQLHRKKRETMTVISGHGRVQRGAITLLFEIGDTREISPMTVHRLTADSAGKEPFIVAEVSVDGVDDTVRLEDDYGRTT